jgi:hypothetical protein
VIKIIEGALAMLGLVTCALTVTLIYYVVVDAIWPEDE